MISKTEDDIMWIRFVTLVIRYDKIIEHFGSIEKFHEDVNQNLEHNGKLILLSEMNNQAPCLEDYAKNKLTANGIEHKKDFVFLSEESAFGVEGKYTHVDHPIYGSEEIEWIETLVTKEGNKIWST